MKREMRLYYPTQDYIQEGFEFESTDEITCVPFFPISETIGYTLFTEVKLTDTDGVEHIRVGAGFVFERKNDWVRLYYPDSDGEDEFTFTSISVNRFYAAGLEVIVKGTNGDHKVIGHQFTFELDTYPD